MKEGWWWGGFKGWRTRLEWGHSKEVKEPFGEQGRRREGL
jgi:hypothetical protein